MPADANFEYADAFASKLAPTGICVGHRMEGIEEKSGKAKFRTQKTPVFRPGSLLSIPNQPMAVFGASRRSVVLGADMAQRTG
ncbi:hypothetical protein, partial [Pseudomonas fluorescens]|uniref:hypothetical protein n=1 Tax=Pseudomonas fluorescens TaxID=294 RepID=UPI001BB14895